MAGRHRRRARPRLRSIWLCVMLAAAGSVAVTEAGRSAATPAPLPTVIGQRTIGHSVAGRPIIAYHLGDPHSPLKTVILGEMHGDEHAGVVVTRAIRQGRPIKGIDLWVIPTMNPDGDAAHRRQNRHGVDLNRNWPDIWVHLTGQYYSGPKALSEPETRAMYAFLGQIKPNLMVSIHQPLHGVDTTDGGARNPAFRHRLSHNLSLPEKAFRCWSVCHGSMTGWLTRYQRGSAITVEFGSAPTTTMLTRTAPVGIVAALGGSPDTAAAHNPHGHVDSGSAVGSTVRMRGWAYDPDRRTSGMPVRILEGSTVRASGSTTTYRADVNTAYHLSGNHGYDLTFAAGNGTHTFCVQFLNVGPGTADPKGCRTVTVNGSPTGQLTTVTQTATSVRLTGWMVDPDAPTRSGSVAVTDNGAAAGTFPADGPRTDVNTAHLMTAPHGFDVTIPTTPDVAHTYCVSAVNLGSSLAPNTQLGCRAFSPPVAAPAPGPSG
jgi:murein peptide amidase A